MDRLEITWKALGLLSFFCSATLRVSGQLPPDPFWLVFDAPTDVRIAGDGLEFGVVGVLLSEFGGDEGAGGWSISIATQGCRIANATTCSTAGDVEENGGLRKARDGFEHTELTNGEGNEGVVSAVTLAFTEKVTLPPEGSPHTIVRLGVEAIVPGGLAVGECTPCTLSYTDGLVGSGQPVDNKVAFRNQTFRPFLVPATVEVCVAESNQIPGDIDQDGDTDGDDSDCQQAFKCEDSQGSVGDEIKIDLFLFAFPDHVQGFSMALRHCCEITAVENLDISNTILEAIGTEFVSVRADSDPDDGDGCELIIGVLVDALPPFDGATIPPLAEFQKVGTLSFDVTDDQDACGTVCPLEFVDGLDGPGKVPVKNLISVDNNSKGAVVFNCQAVIVAPEVFHRGDCNSSRTGSMSVDIADAASMVSFLFMEGDWKFNPTCLDACDSNDDGRIDLADAISVLQFYLQDGAFPSAPGPGLALDDNGDLVRDTEGNPVDIAPGVDPTADKLDCADGTDC